MRVDKYLKITRIIKRRVIAKDVSASGNVVVNHRTVKPSYVLKEGDVVDLFLGDHFISIKIDSLDERVIKQNPEQGYTVVRQGRNVN